MDFSSVTVSYFIHSTEDMDRLLRLVKSKLGLEDEEVSEEKITGYFGNEMISVKAHVIGEQANIVANLIVASLSREAKNSILSELEKSLDEHDSLYLRLDRQTLGEKFLNLSDEEPIRIKFKPKSRSGGRRSIIEQYEELIR
jgi:RNA binding exosome subunit